MEKKQIFYHYGLPYLDVGNLPGKLIVLEGSDCSGRSTQIFLLKTWLETEGYAVFDTGLKRSTLVSSVLEKAKQGNVLGKTTLSLLYATDFAHQLENKIIPAMEAGFIVLADRYIFTMMARDLVRGASKEWLQKLFGFALIPDAVFYIQVAPEELLYRAFSKCGRLNYWESGMDIGISGDMFESFKKYQSMLKKEYDRMAIEYNFQVVNGSDKVENIQKYLRRYIIDYLQNKKLVLP